MHRGDAILLVISPIRHLRDRRIHGVYTQGQERAGAGVAWLDVGVLDHGSKLKERRLGSFGRGRGLGDQAYLDLGSPQSLVWTTKPSGKCFSSAFDCRALPPGLRSLAPTTSHKRSVGPCATNS
jgi:hypothetical protein